MSKIIALFNQAGGVAKSTLPINLGYHLGILGKKILLVDMDPQVSQLNLQDTNIEQLNRAKIQARKQLLAMPSAIAFSSLNYGRLKITM